MPTKIKIEVSPKDAATLEFMQGKCRGLYNWWIGKLRDGERWPGWKVAKKTLQESKQHDPEKLKRLAEAERAYQKARDLRGQK